MNGPSAPGAVARRPRVFLIYPPISKRERYSPGVGSVGGEQIPLGIFVLAAFLRDNGCEVAVRDAEALALSEERLVEDIALFSPDVVGVSSTTVAFHRACAVGRAVKRRFPATPLVLGGPHVTSNAEHAMAQGIFDYGVLGEGELTALELFENLFRGGDVGQVRGIAFRDAAGGVVVTPRRDYIDDLDALPIPAYDLIPDLTVYTPPPSSYRTLPVVNVITSRGCPNQCTFCDRNVFGRRYRERSAENVFREIEHLWATYRVREIAFVDDTFLINKKRVRALFELLDAAGIRFPWTCMARINNVNFEFLRFLRDHGCWNIAFGIESGDEQILKVIRKQISLAEVRQVVDWCAELGISTKGFFIVGHPTETIETIDKTIRFACGLKLDTVVVTINTPIPGSRQYAEAASYGTLDTTDWSKFNYWRPVFVPAGLTQELLLGKQKEFYLRFYLRPRIVFGYLKSFFGRGGMRRLLSILKLVGYVVPQKRAPAS